MIFQHTLSKVLSGEKTQTRRVLKTGEHRSIDDDGYLCVLGASGKVKWRIGGIYSVQPGRGQKGVGFIEIRDIRHELVNSISDEDAIAEGFNGRGGFLATWREIHGRDDQMVWVLEFCYPPGSVASEGKGYKSIFDLLGGGDDVE